ncbi:MULTISPECIES: hypothetical protein [unclassified Shimia]|uniref:hypothetical protein n=1 Tax=unclassified Shimia TaxID=2630038 RepID=UPI001ADA33A8|nr:MULTISPECIES: hypothetical protein [unclassified Shimia]MBO9473534.1 hypothetical protein [Shimia sp. R10_1]MDA5555259.1 hypothetical protein [Shimia sp. MMG029]
MKLVKTVLVTAAMVVAGLFAFSWFTTVTEDDIYAFHELEFDTNPIRLTPGSVVAVSPNGKVTRICDFAIDSIHRGPIEKSIYYNQLRQDFPNYVKSIALVKTMFGSDADKTLALTGEEPVSYEGREFVGRNAAITNLKDTAKNFEDPTCEHDMAWHLSKGFKACTVEKVLNQVVLQESGTINVQTVAVSFAEYSNFVTPQKFDEFGIEYTEEAAGANGQKCEGSSHPWTTVVKRKLNVIQRVTVSVTETISES